MNIEELREICISKAGVTEEFPFDNSALVFKVMGKMFALTNIDKYESVNLKCDPERAVELRETYSGIIPGWHMNKTHWNTVLVDGSVDDSLLVELVQHSYDLVVSKLTKKDRVVLGGL
jgi:predicted DNA-binding protein (MmcQ/YjbR family)